MFEKFDITVYCSTKSYENQLSHYNGVRLEYVNFKANGVQSISYDIVSIFKAIRTSDTLLILGVSGCIVLPLLRLFSNKRLVVNIDGLEWKRDKWNKAAKLFLKFSEKLAVKYANEVITDNKAIQSYVLEEYGRNSKLIAYGADHVNHVDLTQSLCEEYSVLKTDYAFTVCRIEPENNIHLILEAFSNYHNLSLVIIGNWDRSTYGENLRMKYSVYEHIYLLDPIYDQDILNQIRSNCTVYLHGHSAGGTNPSLVEAMYLKLPIVAFDVTYNRYTTSNKARYFSTPEQLTETLRNISHEELAQIAEEMLTIAHAEYTWAKIAKEYSELF